MSDHVRTSASQAPHRRVIHLNEFIVGAIEAPRPISDEFSETARAVFADDAFNSFANIGYEILTDKITVADNRIGRSFRYLTATALILELLMAAKIGEIGILGISVDDPSWLMLMLPVGASILFAHALMEQGTLILYSSLAADWLRARYPALEAKELRPIFIPETFLAVPLAVMLMRWSKSRRLVRAHTVTWLIGHLSVFWLPVIYGAFTYARLYFRDGLDYIALTVSLGASVCACVVGVVQLLATKEIIHQTCGECDAAEHPTVS